MTAKQFIELCDSVQAQTLTHSCNNEREQVHDRLTSAAEEQMSYSLVVQLRSELIMLSILDDSMDYDPYYQILEHICSHFNDSFRTIATWSSAAWIDAISYIKYLPLSSTTNALDHVEFHKQERDSEALFLMVKACDEHLSAHPSDIPNDEVAKHIKEIQDIYHQLGQKVPAFHCRFYSMEQLYFLIRRSKSNDELFSHLDGGCVTTGTQNFWNEHLAVSALNEKLQLTS